MVLALSISHVTLVEWLSRFIPAPMGTQLIERQEDQQCWGSLSHFLLRRLRRWED